MAGEHGEGETIRARARGEGERLREDHEGSGADRLPGTGAAVELLDFRIPKDERGEFIRRNERVWTPALRERKGFIRREIMVPREEPDRVLICVYWRSLADLQAFPEDECRELDARMGGIVQSSDRRVFEVVEPDRL